MKPARGSAAKFAAEVKPQIEPFEPEAIEQFLTDTGICRRIATVYLSKTWSTMTKHCVEDREIAVAYGATFLALEKNRANYSKLAELLDAAHDRLRAALHERDDVEDILAEAGEILAEAAQHDALH